MRPSRPWLIVLVLVAIAAGRGLWMAREESRFRAELARADRDLAGGHAGAARGRLAGLATSRPDDGEVAYKLGLAEQARGDLPAAVAAWSRVAPASSFSKKATVGRARVLIDKGRFAEAERLLDALPRGDGPDSAEARQALELLYRFEGRTADVRRLLIESWSEAPDRASVLRRIDLLDHSAFPLGLVEEVVARGDPDDDRVWLARSNLAALTGRLDEAARWLDACLKCRPDDPSAWLASLELAVAANDPDAAWRASDHLPASGLSEGDRLRLRAWLAAGIGPKAEEEALVSWVDHEPGATAALDRLAELAILRGDDAEAERSRRRKGEVNALLARYKALMERDDRASAAGELADIAGKLGRRVEARGWSLIRDGRAGREPLASAGPSPAELAAGPRLAGLLGDLRPKDVSASMQRARVGSPGVAEFVDDSGPAGLAFVYDNGHTQARRPPPPEAMGGGVGLLDYDGDGLLDVFAVQGGPFPSGQTTSREGDRLFRNRGDGTFEDVTERAGVGGFARGYGHGVAVGDYDNDGRPDLFVTRWRSYALYRNRGDGTFEDATAPAGLGGDRDWPTSAAFADLDGDGDLDLYVCHYLVYDESKPRRCDHPGSPSRNECSPLDFEARPDHAFRNDGGRFVDVTEAAGLRESTGRGLGVVAADLDDDGKVDLYVANDMSANYLYRNLGGFRFEEVALVNGAAAGADGGYKAGMGIACGDLDGDGLIDLAVTNYYGESATFYKNLGRGLFADHSAASGLGAPTRLTLGFGLSFLDADNDGRLDVLIANGHVLDARPKFPWMMPLQLLVGSPRGRLADISDRAGPPFLTPHLGRGFAAGDLDNDGRVDAVVICQNEPLVYLHNRTPRRDGGHFVVLKLEGTASNRDAIGARVAVRAGPGRSVVQRIGGGNYQSSADPRLHVGLGPATRVDEVEVRWPSGRVDRLRDLAADAGYLIREGAATAAPLPGFTPIERTAP